MKSSNTVRSVSGGAPERRQTPKRNAVISLREGRPQKAKTPLRRLARIGPVSPEGPGAVRNPEPKRREAKEAVPQRTKARSERVKPQKPRAERTKASKSPPKKSRAPRRQPIVLSTPRNALPGWHDLASGEKERYRMRARHSTFLETISTVRFGLLILGIALAFTVYVGHVHATQDLMVELQRAKKENLRLNLRHNRLKGVFDQATGPAVIYRRAKDLGLEEGIMYGPTIQVPAR